MNSFPKSSGVAAHPSLKLPLNVAYEATFEERRALYRRVALRNKEAASALATVAAPRIPMPATALAAAPGTVPSATGDSGASMQAWFSSHKGLEEAQVRAIKKAQDIHGQNFKIRLMSAEEWFSAFATRMHKDHCNLAAAMEREQFLLPSLSLRKR